MGFYAWACGSFQEKIPQKSGMGFLCDQGLLVFLDFGFFLCCPTWLIKDVLE